MALAPLGDRARPDVRVFSPPDARPPPAAGMTGSGASCTARIAGAEHMPEHDRTGMTGNAFIMIQKAREPATPSLARQSDVPAGQIRRGMPSQ